MHDTIMEHKELINDASATTLKIQDWAKEDRPREKLIRKGPSTLTDTELIAILLGSGTKNLSVVNLAQQLLKHHNYDLGAIAKLSIQELQKFKGIGEAKAIAIVSAMELGRRRQVKTPVPNKHKITTSRDTYLFMQSELVDKVVEEFWIILLTRGGFVIEKHLVSRGGTARLSVDPKVIFKVALDHRAASIILVHNHPSNNPKPSQLDIELTERLIEVGKKLGLPVLDHLIFTEEGYFSFSDEDLLL
ncbi:MAG: DNA repair protein RadC [Bacteroidota bacterium]